MLCFGGSIGLKGGICFVPISQELSKRVGQSSRDFMCSGFSWSSLASSKLFKLVFRMFVFTQLSWRRSVSSRDESLEDGKCQEPGDEGECVLVRDSNNPAISCFKN